MIDEVKSYTAGYIRYCYHNWRQITKDPWVLDIVSKGLRLDFTELPEGQNSHSHPLSSAEDQIISEEITKLLSKKVIVETVREENDFVSGVFTRDKKDNSKRMILNLKKLNMSIEYQHFKMEHINDVLNIIKPNAYLASVDLKDAFYSVLIHNEHQKYLKFRANDHLYQFISLPNGYGPAMSVYKIVKSPLFLFKEEGTSLSGICR